MDALAARTALPDAPTWRVPKAKLTGCLEVIPRPGLASNVTLEVFQRPRDLDCLVQREHRDYLVEPRHTVAHRSRMVRTVSPRSWKLEIGTGRRAITGVQ